MRNPTVSRLTNSLVSQGLDAVVAVSPENFTFFAGYTAPTQPLMRWRHAAAIVTSDGRSAVMCVDMEETTIRKFDPDASLHVWAEFEHNAMATLADALASLGLREARIGLEFDYLPAGDFAALAGLMPGATFVPFEQNLARLRQIKDSDEIEILRRVSRISDDSILRALQSVGEGSSEMDIGAALSVNVAAAKADQLRLMIVATGPRSELPNVGPTDRILMHGDVCRVEIFTQIRGYLAGVCRTAVVGAPPPHAERVYGNLVECKHLLLEKVKPGASSRAIYDVFTDKLRELDMPPIGFIGHGIGLHLHEDPYLGPYADQELEAGMVLGIEPLVYRTGHGFGMQLKDMIVVTDNGCELLSDVSDTDRLMIL